MNHSKRCKISLEVYLLWNLQGIRLKHEDISTNCNHLVSFFARDIYDIYDLLEFRTKNGRCFLNFVKISSWLCRRYGNGWIDCVFVGQAIKKWSPRWRAYLLESTGVNVQLKWVKITVESRYCPVSFRVYIVWGRREGLLISLRFNGFATKI